MRNELFENKIATDIKSIVKNRSFISGEYTKKLEKKLCEISGSKYSYCCGNGTDALTLALMAIGLKKDEVVFVPEYTFFSTAECVSLLGGNPIFVDINENDLCIDKDSLITAIEKCLKLNLKLKAIISVDIFGVVCKYNELRKIADKYGLYLISDNAQAFGAKYEGYPLTQFANIVCTSFFPSKALSCWGDGGACFTDDLVLYEKVLSYGNNGSVIKNGEVTKYCHSNIGISSRFDEIQASVLLNKIDFFYNDEFQNREKQYTQIVSRFNELKKQSIASGTAYYAAVFLNGKETIKKYIDENHLTELQLYDSIVSDLNVYKDYKYNNLVKNDNAKRFLKNGIVILMESKYSY